MAGIPPCRKAGRLSILAALFFTAGALTPVGTSSGVFGAGEARAVGILQALVKSTLIQAAAGGGKTVDHSGSSADNDSEPASATEESLPGRDLETDVPQIDGTGL